MIEKLVCSLLGLAVACGGAQKPEPCLATNPPAPAVAPPVVEAEADRQPPPGCKLASGRLRLTFAARSTAGDFAEWFAAVSCRSVVLANRFAVRPYPRALERELDAASADQLFREVLAEMGLGVAIDGNLAVVFDDATKLVATVDADKPRVVASGARPAAPEREDLFAGSITEIDATHHVLTRALVDKIVADPRPLARGARIVPSIKDGKANGFKLYAIRPSSFYARVGFRNGDTVHAVNGIDLTTPDRALDAYDKVRLADRIEFEITRRGQPAVIVIEIE